MANPDRPNGFKPASPIMCPRPYKVLAGNGTKIFKGDMMDAINDGSVGPAVAGSVDHLGSNTNMSGHEIALSTAITGAAGFTLLELLEGPEYDTNAAGASDNALWRCRVMEHILRTGKTAVA